MIGKNREPFDLLMHLNHKDFTGLAAGSSRVEQVDLTYNPGHAGQPLVSDCQPLDSTTDAPEWGNVAIQLSSQLFLSSPLR
jgi:hypothetical protein